MSVLIALKVRYLIVAVSICVWAPTLSIGQTANDTKTTADDNARPPAHLVPLTPEKQEKLLKVRLEGGMGRTFAEFSNMFLVMSRIQLPCGVGLMTSSKEIANAELQTVFPKFYKPTLREFLDTIALQTSSEWKYDPTSKYFQSDVETGPVEGLAIFEFTKTKRDKPFEVTLPKGWKSVDKGTWVMYVPPIFPLGMDIYELGRYSCDDKSKEPELFKKVQSEVAMEWAKRAKDVVSPEELHPAKVGSYDALHFETMMPLLDGRTARMRQWVFMIEDKCYFVISTIFPQFEDRIFPDVESIMASFKIGRAEQDR